MADLKEDLITCVIISSIWIVLTVQYPQFIKLWIILLAINILRFYYLTYGGTDNLGINIQERVIINTYNYQPIQLIPKTTLTVLNYEEDQWRESKKNERSLSSVDDLFALVIVILVAILYYGIYFVLIRIKPNTDYYEFSLSRIGEPDFPILHIRSNDKVGMLELAKMISNYLQLPTQVYTINENHDRVPISF